MKIQVRSKQKQQLTSLPGSLERSRASGSPHRAPQRCCPAPYSAPHPTPSAAPSRNPESPAAARTPGAPSDGSAGRPGPHSAEGSGRWHPYTAAHSGGTPVFRPLQSGPFSAAGNCPVSVVHCSRRSRIGRISWGRTGAGRYICHRSRGFQTPTAGGRAPGPGAFPSSPPGRTGRSRPDR